MVERAAMCGVRGEQELWPFSPQPPAPKQTQPGYAEGCRKLAVERVFDGCRGKGHSSTSIILCALRHRASRAARRHELLDRGLVRPRRGSRLDEQSARRGGIAIHHR